MPFYDYRCNDCNIIVEIYRSIKDDSNVLCEICSEKMVRMFSDTTFQLKGGGWAKDSYNAPPKSMEFDNE